MDKALFKRIWRGLACRSLDWRRGRGRGAGRRTGPASSRELEAFAAGRPDPRLMVKPARLGSSVGMTLAHAAAERAAALELAFRYDDLALAERYLPDARDLEVSIIGNEVPLGLYGPGEVVAGHEFYDYAAKYTPGLSETSTRAEVPGGHAGASSGSSRATRTARSAARASPGSTSSCAATSSTSPRSTRSRASRRSASSRRCRPRRASTSPPCASACSTSRSSGTPAKAGRGRLRPEDLPR